MLKERKTVTVEELALSNACQLEAMINVLERKGILTLKEVLDELEVITATKVMRRGLWFPRRKCALAPSMATCLHFPRR